MATINKKRPRAIYHGSQEEFYKITTIGWQSFLELLAFFAALTGYYTQALGNAMLAAIETARAMPDLYTRSETHESLRTNLEEANIQCIKQWKFLESHIKRAYHPRFHKAKLKAAGSKYYAKAFRNNWEYTSALMESGYTFIAENLTTLTAGMMPVGFPVEFETAKTNFDTIYSQFKTAELIVLNLTDAKVNANNDIYKKTMTMFSDAQKIFSNEPALRKRFSFTKLHELVSGTGGSSERSITLITSQNTLQTVEIGIRLAAGAIIIITWGDDSTITVVGNGTSVNFYNHSYILPGNYEIKLTGDISSLLELHSNNSRITDVNISRTAKNITQLILQNNNLSSSAVDDILETINAFNTNNGIINLIGNAPPSPAGLIAKAHLEARGWMVLVA